MTVSSAETNAALLKVVCLVEQEAQQPSAAEAAAQAGAPQQVQKPSAEEATAQPPAPEQTHQPSAAQATVQPEALQVHWHAMKVLIALLCSYRHLSVRQTELDVAALEPCVCLAALLPLELRPYFLLSGLWVCLPCPLLAHANWLFH